MAGVVQFSRFEHRFGLKIIQCTGSIQNNMSWHSNYINKNILLVSLVLRYESKLEQLKIPKLQNIPTI